MSLSLKTRKVEDVVDSGSLREADNRRTGAACSAKPCAPTPLKETGSSF